MIVLKFGGTSVGNAENISKVADILIDYKKKNKQFAVVVSAMSGITNSLIEVGQKAANSDVSYAKLLTEIEKKHIDTIKVLINKSGQKRAITHISALVKELGNLLNGVFLLKELSLKSLDLLQSFGERMSSYIIAQYLTQRKVKAEALDAREVVRTDNRFGNARVNFKVTNAQITKYFKANKAIQIVTGFIASTDKGETSTLGRGGSDYSAAIFGAALKAKEIEIWTDVDGVMTADPRKVKRAFSLKSISYVEAMEMSHFGAKVIYPPTLQPAVSKKIPLVIRNTFNPDFKGTRISAKSTDMKNSVKGISSIQDMSLVSVQGSGMVGVPGVSSRLFGCLAQNDISVVLITQASSEHSICFAVSPGDASKAKLVIEEEFAREFFNKKIDKVHIENDLSIMAIIGENMRNTPGIASTLFKALGQNGINVSAIAQGSSELNISVVIPSSDLQKALNAIHEAYFLTDYNTLNLFCVGVGLIGGTMIDQIGKQANYLLKNMNLKINIVGVLDLAGTLMDENGVDIKDWRAQLKKSRKKMSIKEFVAEMKSLNIQNSVFVDNTASKDVSALYEDILKSRVSIVTPNKIANSGTYNNYIKLQEASLNYKTEFLYEANVGAGLPVISTLKDLKYSGDQFLKTEGILSGTLSYIFNTWKKGVPFSKVVKKAKALGFTEPDPRNDLNGMDVARKILILSREAGLPLEIKNVKVAPLLPKSCFDADSIDDFFVELEKVDPLMDELISKAEEEGKKLRYIATSEKGKAKVKLQAVDANHPFYSLSGSDNIISFTTARYKECPLVIKGPGAGAEVTAAGVFAQIISINKTLSDK